MQVAAIASVFLLSAPAGYACWCGKTDVKEAFDRAKVVFVGEVFDVIPPRNPRSANFVDAAHTIRFRVETAWKEPFWTEANVLDGIAGCSGFRRLPQKGEKYLVYAEPVFRNDPSRREVMTHGCTRTALVSETVPAAGIYYRNQAADDIRMLNAMTMFPPRSKRIFNPLQMRWPDK